jgi:CYTH domain-containing protein
LWDGLISHSADRKVRVRIAGDRATLTIKAKKKGIQDREFQYEIPLCEELLASHCGALTLAKTRYDIPHAGHVWQVDVYEGLLDGIVLAEVELAHDDEAIVLPDWVGAEVTGRPEYKKINMQRARLAAGAATRRLASERHEPPVSADQT